MGILKKRKKRKKSDYESGYAKDFYGSFSKDKELKKAVKGAADTEKKFTHVIKETEKE